MGQIFHACAYDIDDRTCCVIDVDKFHSNCYAHSGAVHSIHYLLRRKPYHVMWGGGYVCIDDYLADVTRTEILLGISTYEDYDSFDRNNNNLPEKNYYEKVKFIEAACKTWNRISVYEDALSYFDWDNTHSVLYRGYLLNISQGLAVNLADYHMLSKFYGENGLIMSIDAIPVLTETGGGSQMAFLKGVSACSTEGLAESWCGDLLQIVDEMPDSFKLINCCFADVWRKADYCYRTFGVDALGYLISDDCGNRYEAVPLNVFGKRGQVCNIRVETAGNREKYVPEAL